MVAENNMVCRLWAHSRMISFICSSKYSSSILRNRRTDRGGALPVGLVQDQDLDVTQLKGGCVVQMVDQTSRCSDQNIWPRPQSRLLGLQVQPTCTQNSPGQNQRTHLVRTTQRNSPGQNHTEELTWSVPEDSPGQNQRTHLVRTTQRNSPGQNQRTHLVRTRGTHLVRTRELTWSEPEELTWSEPEELTWSEPEDSPGQNQRNSPGQNQRNSPGQNQRNSPEWTWIPSSLVGTRIRTRVTWDVLGL
ncbi:hypothetical protein F7725_016313 [Dissostichus mawsoni]|uniref:Uncharacterized protein n=1 Tax=Dissostichus mawsoni TaxID=36200 RepID=A0A7J5Z1N4_DISMA|nr:hypothetical protein F7725_016313 [Dissostichus mawsoni]